MRKPWLSDSDSNTMSPHTLILFSTFTILLFHTNLVSTTPSDIHDLLPQYGFPKGLLPNNAVSYTLSPHDGIFTVQLDAPCYVYWQDQLVYYHTQIKGTLTYGYVSHVSGIQAQKLFLWLPVTGIKLHQHSSMLEFFVGALSQTLPASDFQDVPGCSRRGSLPTNILLPM